MKHAIIALLMSATLLAPSAPSSASDPFSRALTATVLLETPVEGGTSKCSGVVVGGRHIATAAHCVPADAAQVVLHDEENDVAVIETETGVEPIQIAASEPKLRQQAWAIGYPDGSKEWPLVLSTTVAAVESGYRPGAVRNIFHDGTRYGMSGGPIVDSDGKMVGLVSEMQDRGGAVVAASPTVGRLKALLKRVGVK